MAISADIRDGSLGSSPWFVHHRSPHSGLCSPFVSLFAFFALLQLIGTAHASALTTAIGANERLCFYADVDKAGEKIGVSALRVFLHHLLELT